MQEWFLSMNAVAQVLCATAFIWFVPALGAALVFFFKTIDRKVMAGMLGCATENSTATINGAIGLG